jgi:histidinol-phosphatase
MSGNGNSGAAAGGGTEDDLAVARRAVLVGAEVGLRYFSTLAGLPREVKSDGSVVTEADRAVEAAIRAVLSEARPDDAVLGEEAGQTGDGRRRWIIDPIDGTAHFVAGDDRWLVLLALEEAAEITVAVAALPAQNSIWWARRGTGAYRSGADGSAERRIRVDLAGPDVLPGSRFGVIPTDDNLFAADYALVAPLSALTEPVPWDVHPGLLVACGGLDVAVQTRGQLWDFAPTSLIVTEAGGHYSGLDGEPHPRAGAAVFTRSGALHAAALAALTGV